MAQGSYDNPLVATLIALRDRLEREEPREIGERLDGAKVVVTGANRGLGAAIAEDLSDRGARVLLACRGEPRGVRGELVRVDLSDLRSVDRLAAALDGVHALILNAGVVPNRSRPTAQGLEVQLGVNYLANVRLVDRLIARGAFASYRGRKPRIVVVSSESHRSPRSFEIARLGAYDDYAMSGVMRRYGESKLLLTAWAQELAARNDALAVHTICPGPVATGIASEAPRWSQPILEPVIRTFFAAAEVAARPVSYLACAGELEGKTGLYYHRWREKAPAPLALDPAFRTELWNESQRVLADEAAA
jgi:NAD(P)-dependent dehydrogenase (short-subunit alcohol dehydrogenase family)